MQKEQPPLRAQPHGVERVRATIKFVALGFQKNTPVFKRFQQSTQCIFFLNMALLYEHKAHLAKDAIRHSFKIHPINLIKTRE